MTHIGSETGGRGGRGREKFWYPHILVESYAPATSGLYKEVDRQKGREIEEGKGRKGKEEGSRIGGGGVCVDITTQSCEGGGLA